MNILLASHVYPPAVDGGSKIIAKIGDYFKSHHHQILVLTSNCHSTDDFVNPDSKTLAGHDRHVLALPVYKILRRPLKFINLFIRSDFLHILQKGPIFKLIPFAISLNKIISFQPDLIIAGPLPTTIVLYAKLIQKLTGAKLLINASFHPNDSDFSQKPLINTLKSADYIWTLTDHETEYFHQNFRIPVSKMINIGNGIDKTLLKSPHSSRGDARRAGGFDLLFIGSFAAHKGIDTLINAFLNLPPTTSLTLAGQTTLSSHLIESKINRLPPKIQKRINIINNFKNADLARLIDACTILISPSTQESFGLVLLEAWARRKPVIVADIPASLELISKSHGGTSFMAGNSGDLNHKIKAMLDSATLRQQLADSGFRYVQSHATWDKIGNHLWSKISSS